MEENRFCPNCGQPVKPGDVFCGNCGAQLTAQKDSANPKPTQPQQGATNAAKAGSMMPNQRPPKSHKVWPILLVVVLIVAGGGGWIAANTFKHDPVKTASSSSSSHVKVKEADASSKTNDNQSSSSSSSADSSSSSSTSSSDNHNHANLSEDDKTSLNKDFFNWAVDRAKMGKMAVSTWYFDHGAAGQGDWYAITPDGRVQVQDEEQPGKASFKIHAVGGVVFFTSKDGTTGDDDEALQDDGFAGNYSTDVDPDKPVSKYMLGDNGVVYQLQSSTGDGVTTNTGFTECSDHGGFNDQDLKDHFFVSKDTAAQTELKVLLKQYSHH